jgi:alpha-L-fucosidase 2
MLVHRDDNALFIFPALPPDWRDVSFENLAVEGGHIISAIRKNNINRYVKIIAGSDENLKIATEFIEKAENWKAWQFSKGKKNKIDIQKQTLMNIHIIKGDSIIFAHDKL